MGHTEGLGFGGLRLRFRVRAKKCKVKKIRRWKMNSKLRLYLNLYYGDSDQHQGLGTRVEGSGVRVRGVAFNFIVRNNEHGNLKRS